MEINDYMHKVKDRPIYIDINVYAMLIKEVFDAFAAENSGGSQIWHVEDLRANLETLIDNATATLVALDKLGYRYQTLENEPNVTVTSSVPVSVTYSNNTVKPREQLDDF